MFMEENLKEMRFMQVCEFDPLRDVREVEQGLAVDISDMLRTGVVHDAGGELDNNGIDDPTQIIGRVTDEFSAIDAQRAIRKFGKSAANQQAAVEKAVGESSVETPKSE